MRLACSMARLKAEIWVAGDAAIDRSNDARTLSSAEDCVLAGTATPAGDGRSGVGGATASSGAGEGEVEGTGVWVGATAVVGATLGSALGVAVAVEPGKGLGALVSSLRF